ncbi:HAD family hydrolase [Nannocystis pusilla]|uniref:HAD family hydrolase n=1 Tax=Nannocystis pusilla TaxID=889268 RepID=A0A9X3IX17_9BACT|nr:HAD family hydrolase [Nannocystis pusilla]MCY1005353.1 HAD family hydrolase [Nannocystis pusilla]
MADVIAFDADDTLWHNEPLFAQAQLKYRRLLASYHDEAFVERRLHETHIRNLEHFGYGIKGFGLSMVETAVELTEGRITGAEIRHVLELAREMLRAPVELLPHVDTTIPRLAQSNRLMLITKGDLFDQESKIARSGLGDYFSRIEVVSEKDRRTYDRLLARHGVEPARFVMVGNSLRSDVLPVLELGGRAVHIPYATTWSHEHVPEDLLRQHEFTRLEHIGLLPEYLAGVGE